MEIIPKKVSELPKWFNILFYSSLGVLLLSVIAMLALSSSLKKYNNDLIELESNLLGMRTVEKTEAEKNILAVQRKIRDYSFLIDQHVEASEAFRIIQKDCHPKVYFNQLSLSSRNGKVSVNGKAESFEVLGQQSLLLKTEPSIENIELSEVSISKDEGVDFTLSFNFKEGVLKYK